MTDRVLPAIALMIGFCITAPLLDVFSKLAAATIPVGQITTARFVVQSLIMFPVCIALGHTIRVPRAARWLVFGRAVFLIASTYCFVYAVRVMPIADALAIAFVEPFFILLLGYLIFKDTIGPRRIGASITGFCGALLVIQPSFAAFGTVAFYPLGTAITFALYMIVTRSLSRQMTALPMQLHTATYACAICVPVLLIGNGTALVELQIVMPVGINWVWLCGVGGVAAISHLMMTYALGMAPASTLAPLHYLEIVTAVGFGYVIFNDFPNLLTWCGIAVIISSGLFIIHRERQAAQ